MNWQTSLYFATIVLTFLLTGFLSWYAFRREKFPGVRAYGLLAAAECFVSLAEILSMVSPNLAQAQFWFNVRFLPNAFLPLIFLVFALRYNGHFKSLSNKGIWGLAIIPMVTQVMVWTNALNHLWLMRDVLFIKGVNFWIVDIGTRIPSIWFLAHTFYGILLMVTGIVVLFITAWQRRRLSPMQTTLLAAGALVGLFVLIIASFNLLPTLKFNIFIPGLGLSTLFYAVAILKYDFLKTPIESTKSKPESRIENLDRRSLALFISIFIITASGFFSIGFLSYRQYANRYTEQESEQLDSIAQLKVRGIIDWRQERIADARSIAGNANFDQLVDDYLHTTDNSALQSKIVDWLNTIQFKNEYEDIYFLDAQGNPVATVQNQEFSVPDHILDQIKKVIISDEITWLDFHLHADGTTRLAIMAPVFTSGGIATPLGVVVLEISPEDWLYPYLEEWPIASESAETFLVRAEGDAALFLTPLRFQPDAALSLKIPPANSNVLAVKGILGIRGEVEGIDYRNVEVMGAIHEIPDSPWVLVARIDKSEISEPLMTRLWQTVLFFGFLVIASGSSLAIIWRRNRERFYRRQLEATEKLEESEKRYRLITENTSDVIWVADVESGNYKYVSPSVSKLRGFSPEEILNQSLKVSFTRENSQIVLSAIETRMEQFKKNGNKPISFIDEINQPCKDGSVVPTEVTTSFVLNEDGKPEIIGVSRDITARREVEKKLRMYSENLEELVEERTHDLKDAQERALRQERLATLGQLAGSIAHELRNPLGVISNATTFLSMIQLEVDPKVKEYLEIIQSETKISEKIISDMLDFARIQVVERKPISVSNVIQNALVRYPSPKTVSVEVEIPEDLPLMFVNGHHIEQVLGNLLLNAYQAMPGGGKIKISAELIRVGELEEEKIRLTVSDTGEGISPENLGKIFEPLFTTKAKGIGLGLPVCRKFIEANHGEISAISKINEGTTFVIVLPTEKEQK